MRWMITAILPLFLMTGIVFSQPDGQEISAAFFEKDYLFDVVRHLYRWYLDEGDIEKIVGKKDIAFWLRELKPKLDSDDKSRFGEIVVPDLNVKVTVKKADYTVEELGLTVRCDTFKIVNVARGHLPADASGYTTVTASYKAMLDYAHRMRMQTRFPEEELLMRMRLSTRRQILKYIEGNKAATMADELKEPQQTVHLSPLSDVANEVWAFWENGRALIRFSSDADLENSAMWKHDKLAVDLFNIDEQTVVSLDEVAGSNAYLTRDQVGRALFNCIVLGKRLTLQTLADNDGKKKTETKSKLVILHQAVIMFKLDTGFYPSEEEGLIALVEKPSGLDGWAPGGYLEQKTIPRDAWNNEFLFIRNPESGKPFAIASYGADGVAGGEGFNADIYSSE
ncbi:MAG: type II secretion system protein GspG [Planctomycetota bacterium]